jgi:glycosyltransferase involved in cell wall biosynthesis
VSVSVVVLTKDEECNIADCLASVAWSDDVLVVDSFSRDRTVELAAQAGARVLQRKFTNFADQRNFALSDGRIANEWVLHLDADERVSPALREEILAVVGTTRADGFFVASQLQFMGRWIRHAGLYPSYQARLGRRQCLRFKQVGHGQRETISADRMGRLNNPLTHYAFSKGFEDWFDRHNRYSTDEARSELRAVGGGALDWGGLLPGRDPVCRRRALKQLASRLPFRPHARFIYMYLLRGGFLDGSAGLTYCRLLAVYEFMIAMKRREYRRRLRREPV